MYLTGKAIPPSHKRGSNKVVIRWLGAFGKVGTLKESLSWEVSQTDRTALAAEKLRKGKSAITHARVGLLVKNRAILRRYNSDVWSVYNKRGRLKATRGEGQTESTHTECFVRPDYAAIVVKGKITDQALQACRDTGLELLRLTRDGRLIAY